MTEIIDLTLVNTILRLFPDIGDGTTSENNMDSHYCCLRVPLAMFPINERRIVIATMSSTFSSSCEVVEEGGFSWGGVMYRCLNVE